MADARLNFFSAGVGRRTRPADSRVAFAPWDQFGFEIRARKCCSTVDFTEVDMLSPCVSSNKPRHCNAQRAKYLA